MDFSAPQKSRLSAPQLQAQLSRLTDRTRLRSLKSTLLSKGAWLQVTRIEDLCHTQVSHKRLYHLDACAGSVLTPHNFITNVQKMCNRLWVRGGVSMLRFLPRLTVGTCGNLQHSRSHARTLRVHSRCDLRHETCRPGHYYHGTQRTHRFAIQLIFSPPLLSRMQCRPGCVCGLLHCMGSRCRRNHFSAGGNMRAKSLFHGGEQSWQEQFCQIHRHGQTGFSLVSLTETLHHWGHVRPLDGGPCDHDHADSETDTAIPNDDDDIASLASCSFESVQPSSLQPLGSSHHSGWSVSSRRWLFRMTSQTGLSLAVLCHPSALSSKTSLKIMLALEVETHRRCFPAQPTLSALQRYTRRKCAFLLRDLVRAAHLPPHGAHFSQQLLNHRKWTERADIDINDVHSLAAAVYIHIKLHSEGFQDPPDRPSHSCSRSPRQAPASSHSILALSPDGPTSCHRRVYPGVSSL